MSEGKVWRGTKTEDQVKPIHRTVDQRTKISKFGTVLGEKKVFFSEINSACPARISHNPVPVGRVCYDSCSIQTEELLDQNIFGPEAWVV